MKNIFASILLVGLLAACGGGGGTQKEQLEAEIKAKEAERDKLNTEIAGLKKKLDDLDTTRRASGKPVKLATVAMTPFSHSIDVQGRIDAEESVSVGPQMPGLVEEVRVEAGDKVSAGQVLAIINDDMYQQGLKEIDVQLEFARNVFQKQKGLWDQKIGSEIQYLQAKNTVESLEKRKATLTEQLEMTRIKAPMSGTVDEVRLRKGEMAAPGMTTISIVNVSKLKAKAEVAEGYIAKVKKGVPVEVVLPDAGKTIEATLTYSGQIINKLNRTFNVEVDIKPGEENVHPNMVAVLKITDYRNENAIVVPQAAIQQGADGKSFVYVAVKDKEGKLIAQRREVNYLRSYDGKTEIANGQLNPGDQLIIEGYADLNPGDVVQESK